VLYKIVATFKFTVSFMLCDLTILGMIMKQTMNFSYLI